MTRPEYTCEQCGTTFYRRGTRTNKRFCSLACRYASQSKPRTINRDGYVQLWDGHGGCVLEHRAVMERVLGRPLLPSEHVHHKDEDRAHNDPSNLEVLPISEHMALHASKGERWAKRYDACVECGRTDRNHQGHGVCQRCAQRRLYRRQHGTAGYPLRSNSRKQSI